MKAGDLSIAILTYFVGNVIYMLLCPPIERSGQSDFQVWLRVFYYLLIYALFLYFAIKLTKHTYYSLDLFFLLFFKIYVVFKFIFFLILINKDLPTYDKALDSKPVSLILSLSVFIVVIISKFIWK